MPIIDYHNHLPPQQIAAHHRFDNLTQIWLYGDHYKWRAMRANGIPVVFCTGQASDWEKFEKWAQTVPYTLRNPLYHWTHLELQRYFGITELLSPKTARAVYEQANEQLNSPSTRQAPVAQHERPGAVMPPRPNRSPTAPPNRSQIRRQASRCSRLSAHKAMAVEDTVAFNAWTDQLSAAADVYIASYDDFSAA